MAKTPRLKNASKPTPNSRAARKLAAADPLVPRSPPRSSRDSPTSFLAPSQHAGISKRKKQKPLKRRQRMRLELGKEKAENVQGRTEVRLIGSKGRGERRKARRADWEDIDKKIGREVGSADRKGKGKKQVIEGQVVERDADSAAVAAASKDVALDNIIEGLDLSYREGPSTAPEVDEEIS